MIESHRNPAELADWSRIRRYAVPRWMIERATERRLAGDWRGACEAAGFEVAFDLDEVAREHGDATAEELAGDLAHLVPDLVRWHLPRVGGGRTTIATHRAIILADYPDAASNPERRLHTLHVETPTMVDGPQRPRLLFGGVRETALFPERPETGPAGPPGPSRPLVSQVRCRGEWHEMHMRDGVLQGPHTAEERARELAMHAFGGKVAGCFAAEQAWRGTEGARLPKALREQRKDLFLRVQHGDTPGVLELLDAGVDPHVRDGRRQTLLHHLHKLDHSALLPHLLEAGLDLEARDHHDRTPLLVVVAEHGSEDLVRALLEAGARIDVLDHQGCSLRYMLRERNHSGRTGVTELAFLSELLGTEPLPGEMIHYDAEGIPF